MILQSLSELSSGLNSQKICLTIGRDIPAQKQNSALDTGRFLIYSHILAAFLTFSFSASLIIGYHGAGELVQTGGALHVGGYFVLGRYAGDWGAFTMTGGTFVQDNLRRGIVVGEEGSGTMTLGGTADLTAVKLTIGRGTVNLATGAVVRANVVDYDSRYGGTPVLNIDGGTLVANDESLNVDGFVQAPLHVNLKTGGATIDVPTGRTAGVGTALAGSAGDGGLRKTGAGTLRLLTENGFTGPTRVAAGALVASSATALASSSGVTVDADAAFGLSLTALDAVGLAFMNGVSFAPGSFFAVDVGAGRETLATTLALPAGTGLAKTGSGILAVAADQAHASGTALYGGILKSAAEGACATNGPLIFRGGSYAPYGATYLATLGDGAGQLQVTPDNDLSLSAVDGPLTVDFQDDLTVGDAFFNPNRLRFNDAGATHPITLANDLALVASKEVVVHSPDQPVVFAGQVKNAPNVAAGLAKSGVGTLSLAGGAQMNGELYVREGTVDIRGESEAHMLAVNVSGGALRVPDGNLALDDSLMVGNNNAISGSLEIGNGSIACNDLRVGAFGFGTVNQTGGSLHRRFWASAESYLGGHDQWHTGATGDYTLSGGTVQIDFNFQVGRYGRGTLAQTGGDFTCANWFSLARFWTDHGVAQGTYDLSGGTFHQTNPDCGVALGEEGIGTWTIRNATADIAGRFTFSGGSGWKTSAHGTLNLLEGGRLCVNGLERYDSRNPMTLNIDGGTIVARGTGRTLDMFFRDIENVTIGTRGLTLDTGDNTVVINQPLSDKPSGGGVTKTGTGTLVLSSSGDFTGGLDVRAGTVVAGPVQPSLATSAAPAEATTVPGLAHRWSFNGSLADSVGGSSFEAAYFGGAAQYTADSKAVTLKGGAHGTSGINLGQNLFPTDGSPVTLEIWAKQREVKNWSRVFDFGGQDSASYILLAWSVGTSGGIDHGEIKYDNNVLVSRQSMLAPFNIDTPYHISAVFTPNLYGDGRMHVRWQKRTLDGKLEKAGSFVTPNPFSFAEFPQNAFYLGRSRYDADNDAAADYDEVRIWNTALSDAQLTANAKLGPDALPDIQEDDGTAVDNVFPQDPSRELVARNYLTHRWSFNGDPTDSVGGQDAQLCKQATYNEAGTAAYLPGGDKGTAWIDLHANVLPANGPVTLEIWATEHSVQNWSRILEFGNPDDYMNDNLLLCWTQATDTRKDGICIKAIHKDNYTRIAFDGFELNRAYHLAYVFNPTDNGLSTVVTCYQQDAATGETLKVDTFTAKNWTLAQLTQTDCWLGRSHYQDRDPNASYDEVRVWNAALGERQLRKNALAGPDRVPTLDDVAATANHAFSPLSVAPGATFNLAAHRLTVQDFTGGGTLAGSGTLALMGEWLIDVAADGTVAPTVCSCPLDLTHATIIVNDPSRLPSAGCVIATGVPSVVGLSAAKTNLEGTGLGLKFRDGTLRLAKSAFTFLIR